MATPPSTEPRLFPVHHPAILAVASARMRGPEGAVSSAHARVAFPIFPRCRPIPVLFPVPFSRSHLRFPLSRTAQERHPLLRERRGAAARRKSGGKGRGRLSERRPRVRRSCQHGAGPGMTGEGGRGWGHTRECHGNGQGGDTHVIAMAAGTGWAGLREGHREMGRGLMYVRGNG